MHIPLTTEQRSQLYSRTYERITAYPDTHDQAMWLQRHHPDRPEPTWLDHTTRTLNDIGLDPRQWEACGTTACFAGHLVAAAMELDVPTDALRPMPAPSMRERTIPSLARELLGDDHDEGMFCPSTTRDLIVGHLEQLIEKYADA